MEQDGTGTAAASLAFDRARQKAATYRALGNPRRLMILWALSGRELSVGQIAETIGASLPSTSQHLRVLRRHAFVQSRREAQTVYYCARLDQSIPEIAAVGNPTLPAQGDAL
ncbi:MAG TPA: metalloregulator ArsR/SmtB family transcription factor [Anaerolineales bacterium]|nr:metalloregulator ArsR/SmtB family transcription factor [Anaerolineales bacterium]